MIKGSNGLKEGVAIVDVGELFAINSNLFRQSSQYFSMIFESISSGCVIEEAFYYHVKLCPKTGLFITTHSMYSCVLLKVSIKGL